MDDIDRILAGLLQGDGRLTSAQMAPQVGLSVSAVNERVRRLQAHGAVREIVAHLDPQAVGCPVLAFLLVAVDLGVESAFVAAITARPEVLECHHITGDWSYLLKVRVASIAALETFLTTAVKVHGPGVRTHTQIALSSRKETAALPLSPPEATP